ncbi:MAG: hypothetical protein QWI36_02470 [Wolbachia endosymbiont of Tyrophagus putrescentiae]|nr:hypothetical protein [Wolbachia endosymbiont of Tyrophagus putrescentiae]
MYVSKLDMKNAVKWMAVGLLAGVVILPSVLSLIKIAMALAMAYVLTAAMKVAAGSIISLCGQDTNDDFEKVKKNDERNSKEVKVESICGNIAIILASTVVTGFSLLAIAQMGFIASCVCAVVMGLNAQGKGMWLLQPISEKFDKKAEQLADSVMKLEVWEKVDTKFKEIGEQAKQVFSQYQRTEAKG